MAEQGKNIALSAQGFGALPVVRQLGLLIGLAAAIAVGGSIVMWAQTPNYRTLFSGLAEQDVMQVTDALTQADIPFKLSGTGSVLVPGDQVFDARLKMASQGLPNSTTGGFELLEKDQGFGTSQFIEKARYQRAIEGELARTISSIRSVESARVHLAIPKQSVFVRDRKPPSASVTINMFPGRNLDEDQVAAIAHMVSSSVPNLDTSHVTIVDQQGRLLTSMESSAEMGMTTSQFSYRKKLEQYLVKRIEDLISPIVGPGGVRAQVATELDFSFTEQTQESFNPDLPAIRSEQTTEEQMTGSGAAAGGVPGALTNQPPEGGTTAAGGGNQAAQAGGETAPTQSNRRITRNYELDRTISHVRLPAGTIRRLSIAVVIDDKTTVDDAGAVTRQPLTEDELGRITNLVKEAVGFSQRRGDSVSVINSAFSQPAPAEPLPEPGLLEQPWVWDAGKIALGGIGVIFLIFGLLKPVMRSLAEKGAMLPPMPAHGQLEHDQLSLTGGQTAQLPASSYDTHLTTAKSMAQQDPKRVAQVVKQWVSDDG